MIPAMPHMQIRGICSTTVAMVPLSRPAFSTLSRMLRWHPPDALSRPESMNFSASSYARVVTIALLGLAAGMRLWGIGHDLPFSFYGDELHMMKRAMAMGTGDLNPHWFHKPAFLLYVLLAVYGSMFGAGRLAGWFESSEHFGAFFLHDYAPFMLAGRLVVVAFGIAAVYFTYRLGRDATRSRLTGVGAGVAAAVVPGLVASGQNIKSDVPCAALMMAALSVYWHARTTRRTVALLSAGLLSGAAMGMHFYAIVLLPTFVVLEASALFRRHVRLAEAVRGLAILGFAFCVAMFVTSPYTFLDPDGTAYLNPEQDGVNFVPYTRPLPVTAWWYSPVVYIVHVLVGRDAFGSLMSGLAALGIIGLLRASSMRDAGLLIGVPVIAFIGIAAAATGYQAEPRHLSALYPLLAIAASAGALAIARRITSAKAHPAAAAVLIGCLLPSVFETASRNRRHLVPDSRVAAYRWIMSSLPRDGRVLLDEYGPQLPANEVAVQRVKANLNGLADGPFTAHQRQRLDLLARYPVENAFDVEELGHQWWLGRELTDDEIRQSAFHRDMSNPVVSRVPQSLAAYRARGIRWVITNSAAQSRYRVGYKDRDKFPSFAAFYDSLPREARLVRQFDPADWGGKGPVIWIYELTVAP